MGTSSVSVLFVCMGNICRSPTAEGVFRSVVEREGLGDVIHIDSAGTHAYHVGEGPDRRSQQAALKRGIDLSAQRARRARKQDFARFDYLLAMDRDNLQGLLAIAPPGDEEKARLFLTFAPSLTTAEVPDPYYGSGDGFETVLDLIEAASEGLLAHIRQHHL